MHPTPEMAQKGHFAPLHVVPFPPLSHVTPCSSGVRLDCEQAAVSSVDNLPTQSRLSSKGAQFGDCFFYHLQLYLSVPCIIHSFILLLYTRNAQSIV